MTTEHYDNKKKGSFKVIFEGIAGGEIFYTWAGPAKLIIDHTEVFKGFEGKGIGKILVMKVAELAREKNVKLLPLCPYARALFQKMPELKELEF